MFMLSLYVAAVLCRQSLLVNYRFLMGNALGERRSSFYSNVSISLNTVYEILPNSICSCSTYSKNLLNKMKNDFYKFHLKLTC